MGQTYKYQAFISYAHTDEAAARRIHNALETFPIPADMDRAMRKKLTPIFRDVTELTAHHSLSEKIQEAVKNSRFLIVLCSPSAKSSHWVNEEIKLFRRLHGESAILSVIVDGDPETAFPPALTEDGREPLAANMTTREGFRFGVSQLAASMLGVGLDRLVQRDTKRRRKRMQLITTGALLFAGLMGGMAWTAVDARDEAEISRSEAEKMVEFMLTDLKEELEPLGRLSVLDDVGTRVTDYYDAIPLPDMDDDRLARQARARHLLGQVAENQGHAERAVTEIHAAYKATKEILRRNPTSINAIHAHSQSAYWLGELSQLSNQKVAAKELWLEYALLSKKLIEKDGLNYDWNMEAGWSQNNLGLLELEDQKWRLAIEYFASATIFFKKADNLNTGDNEPSEAIANAHVGISKAHLALGNRKEALQNRKKQLEILNVMIQQEPYNLPIRFRRVQAIYHLVTEFNTETENPKSLMRLATKEMNTLVNSDPTNKYWSEAAEKLNQVNSTTVP